MLKEQSFEFYCKSNDKLELLKLFDLDKNKEKPNQVYYSGTKKYFFKCPTCHMEWIGKMNKMNRLSKGEYNVIKKQKEITYCPYCKGTRVSRYYNLVTEYPEILDYWDTSKNKIDPTTLFPKTHIEFYLKCKNKDCDYQSVTTKKVRDFVRDMNHYQCPKCSNGKNVSVNEWNNLKVKHPDLLKSWDYGRNTKKPEEFLPSSNDKVWWKCSKNHRYLCRIGNKTFLNRGCPICYSQHKTSFLEQAIYFYIKKCFFDAINRAIDHYTKKEIDILIPSKRIAIEVNSKYFHKTRANDLMAKDREKLLSLSTYYQVYSIQEFENKIDHPLIKYIKIPLFSHSRKVYEQYNDIIYHLLRELDPNCTTYPNINIERDTIDILNQYIRNDVENSFEDQYPIYSKDWNYNKNGNLTPSMFKYSNNAFKFHWICSSCGREYQMSMSNRVKVKERTCPYCAKKSEKANSSNSLASMLPILIPYWHPDFNQYKITEVRAKSEKIAIFMMKDRRCVPVRICNIVAAFKNNPNMDIDCYLEGVLKRLHQQIIKNK